MAVTRRAFLLLALAACSTKKHESPPPQTIRVAVIGGMLETGFWQELTARYEAQSGNKVELVASGPKPVVIDAFRKGGIDLITLHASDAIVNLVVDGLAADPQPWAQNDLVIVGPSDDPAKIRGLDALTAVKALVAARAPLLIHASLGADGVLHDLEHAAGVTLPDTAQVFSGENQHQILARAAELHAYTMVGRIPMLLGKLKQPGIEILVRGDGRLRRPYLVAVAKRDDPRVAAARDLAAFLRRPETQAWIATYKKGTYDDAPLFFPVVVSR